MRTAALLAGLVGLCHALYTASDSVIQASDSDFKRVVLQSDKVAIVEFFAPWCGHCKSLAPEYKKLAKKLGSNALVVAVDATENQKLAKKYKIQGFPTLKIFLPGNKKPLDYNGGRTAKDMYKVVAKHAGIKSKSSSSSSSSKSSAPAFVPGKVVKLTDETFDSFVFESDSARKNLIVVAFTAPWCGHCKALEPEYKQAAKHLAKSGGVVLASVDATSESELATRFGIQGFPTIKYFAPGASSDSEAKDYQGAREADAIVDFSQSEFEKSGGALPAAVSQLTSRAVFETTCENKCLVVLLPDLYEWDVEKRNQALQVLTDAAKKIRHVDVLWASRNDHPDLERALRLEFGFPAAVYVKKSGKNFYAFVDKGSSFSPAGLAAFATAPRGAASADFTSTSLPDVETVPEWDGKGAPEILENDDDDFDLDAFLAETS